MWWKTEINPEKLNKTIKFYLLKKKLSGILVKYRGRGGMADAQD